MADRFRILRHNADVTILAEPGQWGDGRHYPVGPREPTQTYLDIDSGHPCEVLKHTRLHLKPRAGGEALVVVDITDDLLRVLAEARGFALVEQEAA